MSAAKKELQIPKPRSRRLPFLGLLILLGLLAAGFAARGVWLPWAAGFLIVNEPLHQSDLIVIVNGINSASRVRHGVRLYQEGLAPKMVISGSWELAEETATYPVKLYAESLGVSAGDILMESRSRSTYENALYLRKLLEEKNYNSFILVTSPAHSRRARLIFSRVIPPGISWSVSCNPDDLNRQRWWADVETSREVLYEYFGILFFLFHRQ